MLVQALDLFQRVRLRFVLIKNVLGRQLRYVFRDEARQRGLNGLQLVLIAKPRNGHKAILFK